MDKKANIEESLKPIETKNTDIITKEYRCKMCRRCLFTNKDIKHPNEETIPKKNECTSFFLDYPDWINTKSLQENDSKFTCPNTKCNSKLGKIMLSGNKCSCGEWITPAFQVNKAHIDIVSRAIQKS